MAVARTRGVEHPWWNKPVKRWFCRQLVNGVLVEARFYTEESALKWFNAPLDWPDLPLTRTGLLNKKFGRLMSRTTATNAPFDVDK
jgi:hypothetical protein